MGRRAFTRELAEKNGLAVDRYSVTEEEAQLAQDVLIKDLEKLSLDDREKLVLDIHGFDSVEETTDKSEGNKTEKALQDLEVELQKFDASKKTAYEQALHLNPEYVQSSAFRKPFLISTNNDVQLAADQIVQHFENKKQLFGSGEILGRRIRQSDLSEEEMKLVRNSCFQVLPNRDIAGRLVCFGAPGYSTPSFTEKEYRAYWYLQQVTHQGEGMENGLVMVNWYMGKYGRTITIEELEGFTNNLVDGQCTKLACEHFCYDDPKMNSWISSAPLFSDECFRHRLRCHYGTKEEVIFKLQTFGIQTDDFPINDEQTLDYTFHRQWVEAHRKREEEEESAKDLVLVPKRFDVLFGRGRDTRVHSGNLRVKHLVEMRMDEYESANKTEKTKIAEQVVASVKASFGRFLKWEDDGWKEVDDDAARYKVAHFFRRQRLNNKNSNNQQNNNARKTKLEAASCGTSISWKRGRSMHDVNAVQLSDLSLSSVPRRVLATFSETNQPFDKCKVDAKSVTVVDSVSIIE